MNAPDAVDILEEEARGQSTILDAWSPYESKTVSRHFNNRYSRLLLKIPFHSKDVPPQHAGQPSQNANFKLTHECISLGTL